MLSNNFPINLLLVDDNVDNLQAIEMALEQQGLNIFTCSSPQDALQLCIANSISIALIDVHMPGMDGYELLDQIKNDPATNHILVILITGYSMSSNEVVKGLNKGAVDYLFKPLDLYITLAKVNSLIALVNYQMEIKKSKKEKENFLANMSHEIRTPLNSIIGLIHLLKATEIDNEQTELVGLMEYTSKTLLGIVNDILDSSKIDAGKIKIVPSEINLGSLTKNVCDLLKPLANEKGLTLSYYIDEDVPLQICADPLRLNQVLINLINNSIKFTNKGSVNLIVKNEGLRDNKVHLEFTIRDTGVGIPEESIKNIFNRFEQVDDNEPQQFGGTGLGLSIVKKIIELYDGTFKITSKVNEGTNFTFGIWFKLAENAVDTKSAETLSKFEDVNLLLVEDNPINQRFVYAVLKKWNINVDIATNGLEAFEKTRKNDYDIILMDTHMPVMNGYEATKKIRNELDEPRKNISIISFSAAVTESEKNMAFEAGTDDFVEKPFELARLHHKIKKLLSKNRAGSPVIPYHMK